MSQEIEYAEMLEIPVSTVNVVRKTRRRKQKTSDRLTSNDTARIDEGRSSEPLKNSVIAQVNERLEGVNPPENDAELNETLLPEESEGALLFNDVPDRIDTVRLYSTEETNGSFNDRLWPQDYALNGENGVGRYEAKQKNKLGKAVRIALGVEFAAACALCGAIFLTNVFMPTSAINTFFRSIHSGNAEQVDLRPYTEFTLSPIVSELSDAELTLSAAGILSFTDACCVYPAADGTVANVTQNADGTFTVKLSHSNTFTGVISGLDYVYYEAGDEVKANVPLGYSNGEEEVQVTMYSSGALLNCFELTEENCLAWVETPAE